jgi:Secretion system C-terminal sorting domain
MKKTYLIFLILFSVFELRSQSVVTFENNVFKVNGAPFFPIGWYDGSSVPELTAQHNSGANTVLVLWDQDNFIPDNYYNNGVLDTSPTGYLNALVTFLGEANSLSMKVIIQLPYKQYRKDSSIAITNDSYVDAIVPALKNNPALLGWYLADEPEFHSQVEPYTRLQHWYRLIKTYDPLHPDTYDPNHPVFVVCSNGYVLENNTIGLITDPNNPWYNQPFFDVLMQDKYVIASGDNQPSPNLGVFDEWNFSLYDCFERYANSGLTASSTMPVTQGYGLDRDGHPQDGLRDPDSNEVKYEVISSLTYAQNDGYPNPVSKNSGGLLFWRYEVSRPSCQYTIGSFIKYFTGNSLDAALRQPNINVHATSNNSQVQTFLRYYNGSYYLFAVNRSDISPNPTFTLSNIGSYLNLNCIELTIPLGTSNPKTLNNGSITETLGKREARVYKIQSPFPVSISGPRNLGFKQRGTWTANPSANSGYLVYQWYISFDNGNSWGALGTNQSQGQMMFFSNFIMRCDVGDNGYGKTASARFYVQNGIQQVRIGVDNGEAISAGQEIPNSYSIDNYPNPFNPSTSINYQLPVSGFVKLSIFDVLGREVVTLVNGEKPAGYYSTTFEASRFSSGLYFARISVISSTGIPFVQTIKMLLTK